MSVDAVCPWEGFAPETGDMFCEATLCAWVKTPANAWSSMAYALVGLAVLWAARRPAPGHIDTRPLGLIGLWLGAGSFFLHASMSYLGQVADLLGMFMVVSWAASTNAARTGLVCEGRARWMLFGGLVLVSLGLMNVMGFGTPAVAAVALFAMLLELRLFRRGEGAGG